jgi:DNA (cytosine-5)-methyltransferase 1
VFSRQRSDEFLENKVTATQSARQHKDATDLVCEPYQDTVGTIGYTDHKGINNQYVSEDKCIVEKRKLIRRLTPLECERLQGFPDYWTDIPGASDSARYKALGNSVAIPCVDFILRGIAYFLRQMKEDNP